MSAILMPPEFVPIAHMRIEDGIPQIQRRPKIYRVGDGMRAVDPSKREKEALAVRMRQAMRGCEPFRGPLGLHLVVRVPSKTRHVTGMTKAALYAIPTPGYRDKRPDIDNYLKLLMDAGNGIWYEDDGQIALVIVEKIL
jgi:Holliday junction resolvase RusA-like endonuclease